MTDLPDESAGFGRVGLRKRGGAGIRLAAVYYLIAGLITAALAAAFAFSLLQVLLAGYCDTIATAEPWCGESLQAFLAPILASAVSLILLATATRLRQESPRLGLLVHVGVALGIAVAVLPIVLILSVADLFGSIGVFGPMVPTVNLVLPFVGPLLWALASAVAVWRHALSKSAARP